jgi:hypothetical protein
MLVVRGAKHHAPAIHNLLTRGVPQSANNPNIQADDSTEISLKLDCLAWIYPEQDNPFDEHAVAVSVQGHRVGYISRHKAKVVKGLIGTGIELNCTIFWNGDPDADFQFYTVQLFPPPAIDPGFRGYELVRNSITSEG